MKKWITLITVSLAMFIIVLDTTVMNVSISYLVQDLNTTVSGIQTAIAIYALVMASFMLISGKLGERFGARKIFIIGLVVFGIGTSTAAISQSLAMLIIGWSIVEGIGAALLFPNIQTLIRSEYKDKDRALSYGVIGAMSAVGAALGPLIGGLLTTFYTWRLAFAFEVIIVVLCIIFSRSIKKDVVQAINSKFDILGSILTIFGLASLVLGILLAQQYGWFFQKQPFVIGGNTYNFFGLSITAILIAFSIGLIAILFKLESYRLIKNKDVLFDPALFKIEHFTGGLSTMFLQTFLAASFLFIFPLFLQYLFNFSAMQTGVALMPLSISILIFSITGAKLTSKIPSKRLIQFGFLLSTLSFFVLAINTSPNMNVKDLLLGTMILGAGIGLIASQVVNLVLSLVDDHQTPTAAGINSTYQQLGNSIGVALMGTILASAIITSSVNNISNDPNISQQNKDILITAIETNLDTVSQEELQLALQSSDLSEEQLNQITFIKTKSITDAFSITLVALSFLSVLGFINTVRLPNKKLVS